MKEDRVKVLLHRTSFWSKYWRECKGRVENGEIIGCSYPAHVEIEMPPEKLKRVSGYLVLDNDTVEKVIAQGHTQDSPLLDKGIVLE